MSTSQTPKQQLRAACYCRISSDPNDKREGVTRQRQDTTDLCAVKGWTVVDYYIDNDRSATSGKPRPEWERLLADIEAGKIDAVAAWDQDRVNRTMDDLQRYQKVFANKGTLFATTNGGEIDLATPQGVLFAQMRTANAQFENSMMRVRMKRAARQKAEQGTPKWKRAFGYLPETRRRADDDGTREIDPVTAPLVRDAYAAVLAGSSLSDIVRMLNDAGAYGMTGKPWTATTVSLFLRAPRNAGLRSHNDEIVGKASWPALVDESTWRAAQAVLNAPGRTPGRKSVRRHLLTGLLQCGKPDCGGYLSGQHTTQKSIAYACKSCHGVSVRAEHVEPLLYKLVGGRLAESDAVDLLKAEIHDAAEAETLRLEKATLYKRLDEMAVERAQGLMTGRQLQVASDVVQQQIEAIDRKEQDQERLRVFDGIPLGTPQAVAAVQDLSADRFRAVVNVLMTVSIAPTGKGGHVFKPERVQVTWR